MVDVFLKLEALGEWKLHLIAHITHYILILLPLGCIKLSLKILSGNVSHRYNAMIDNDLQTDMIVMRLSLSLFFIATLGDLQLCLCYKG